MEQIHPNWSSLPNEILKKIFLQIVAERPQHKLCNSVLVCRAWLNPAQLVLYSNINVSALPQLRQFYSTIVNNNYLGELVKNFDLCFQIPKTNNGKMMKLEIFDTLSSLLSSYLPNLEKLSECALNSYNLTLNALLDHRLENLKVLSGPVYECREHELANYITCVMLMKGRLENLTISDNFVFQQEISTDKLYFNRLYSNLNQFDRLTAIRAYKKTDDAIQFLDNIVGACKSLKDITMNFRPLDEDLSADSNVSIDEISNVIPSTSIKSLNILLNSPNDYKLLLYIFHKFSQLHIFTLKMKSNIVSTRHLDNKTFIELLNYLPNIRSYAVFNIKIDFTHIAHLIGSNWKATSEHGSKRVEFIIKRTSFQNTQLLLNFSKREESSITSTSFKYYVSHLDWERVKGFLNKNGEFICDFHLAFEAGAMAVLPPGFLQYTFTCCPNLRQLHFRCCNLCRITDVDFSKRLSIDELYIDNCNLHTGFLEHWSLLIPRGKRLRLGKIIRKAQSYDVNGPPDPPFLVIAMPSTKIESIVFEQDYSRELISLKFFVSTPGAHYYYQYNPSGNGNVSISTEQEYTDTVDSKRIYVCCQTKPDVQFKT